MIWKSAGHPALRAVAVQKIEFEKERDTDNRGGARLVA